MKKISLTITIALSLLLIFMLFLNKSPLLGEVAQGQKSSIVSFPNDGPLHQGFIHAFAQSNGPGFGLDGPPTAIYQKSMQYDQALALLDTQQQLANSEEARRPVWLIVLEGRAIGITPRNFSQSADSSAPAMTIGSQLAVVVDATSTNPIITAGPLVDKTMIDVSSFTRYALPTAAEYAFPEPQPTQAIAPPILRTPPPFAPDGQDLGYPAPVKP